MGNSESDDKLGKFHDKDKRPQLPPPPLSPLPAQLQKQPQQPPPSPLPLQVPLQPVPLPSFKNPMKSMRRRSTTVATVNRTNLTVIQNEIDKLERKRKPLLSQFQKSILVKSWNHHSYRHSHSSENIGVKIYLKLFDVCPETKVIFGFDKFQDDAQLMFDKRFIRQTKLFIAVIENSLKNLDHLDDVVQPNLFALGGRHVRMRDIGFKVQHLDVFAESMLECIIEAQGMHRHRDTTAAWRVFISWMIGIMKDGYFYTMKMQRRSTIPNDNMLQQTNYEQLQRTNNNNNNNLMFFSPNIQRGRKMDSVQHSLVSRNEVKNALISRV